jgi:hypothetical protein
MNTRFMNRRNPYHLLPKGQAGKRIRILHHWH